MKKNMVLLDKMSRIYEISYCSSENKKHFKKKKSNMYDALYFCKILSNFKKKYVLKEICYSTGLCHYIKDDKMNKLFIND